MVADRLRGRGSALQEWLSVEGVRGARNVVRGGGPRYEKG
jgi:hypothetical protein